MSVLNMILFCLQVKKIGWFFHLIKKTKRVVSICREKREGTGSQRLRSFCELRFLSPSWGRKGLILCKKKLLRLGLAAVNKIGELFWWILSEKSEAGIMGAVCCCLSVEDFEDYVNPNSSVYRNCICLSCFLQNFINVVYLFACIWRLLFCDVIRVDSLWAQECVLLF